MNSGRIIRGAWQMMLRYRTLWLFGLVLTLTTISWGTLAMASRSGGGDQADAGLQIQRRSYETFAEAFERTMRQELDQAARELDEFMARELHLNVQVDLVALLTTLLGVTVALYILGKMARYVSETALMRLVDRYEETGRQVGAREGFRLGWSRVALRLFLIALIINLVATAAGLLLFALIFGPLPLWVEGGETTVVTGAIITAALFFVAIFVLVIGGMGVTLVRIFAWRAAALEGLGVIASVHRGYSRVRGNLKALLPLGLVALGVNLAHPTVVAVLAIPLFGLGLLLGSLPGLLVSGLAHLAAAGETAVVLGIGAGAIVLLVVILAPLVLVDGLREVLLSSLWTLAHRELLRLEAAAQEAPPDLGLDPL